MLSFNFCPPAFQWLWVYTYSIIFDLVAIFPQGDFKLQKSNWIKAIPTIQTINTYYNKLLVFLRIYTHAILTQLLKIMLERTFNSITFITGNQKYKFRKEVNVWTPEYWLFCLINYRINWNILLIRVISKLYREIFINSTNKTEEWYTK